MQAEGITKQRLASYDRPIVSEPKFDKDQTKQLRQDLTDYLQTLKVSLHSMAVTTCFRTHSYMK
jgi:alpha-glucan,water dikinase